MGDSRLDKFEKRRKNTKFISILLIAAGFLVLLLLAIWIFGGGDGGENQTADDTNESSDVTINDDEAEGNTESTEEENTSQDNDQAEKETNEDEAEENEEQEESGDYGNIETEPAEPSGEQVTDAYTGNWPPIGTEQEGPHTTDYTDDSQDRIEIARAAAMVTGLDEESMNTNWVGNDGEQQVFTVVSSSDYSEVYRVFLSWVDGEGWQPTKVEELNEVVVPE